MALLLSGCIVGEGINALVHTGSGTFERANRQREIERVARDWCLTLRASQIIPIYPLREDLHPGTMFVTSTNIDDLRSYWKRKGYLPMDSEFDRLPSEWLSASNSYRGSFGVRGRDALPDVWRFPQGPSMPGQARTTAWENAPLAAFPSYSFKINRGEGFTGALPIQGVPVMFSSLNARSATVSVTLTQCYTYGIPQLAMQRAVARWVANQDNRFTLGKYLPANGEYRWLRVVTRVYLAKTVSVSVTMDKASSAKLSVGEPKPVSNIFIAQGDAAGNYERAAGAHPTHLLTTPAAEADPTPLDEPVLPEKGPTETDATANNPLATPDMTGRQDSDNALRVRELNADLQAAKLDRQKSQIEELKRRNRVAETVSNFGGTYTPGASMQITSASASSVSMNETFANPIVIGYEAIDYAIIDGIPSGEGTLIDAPVSAFLNLEGRGFSGLPKSPPPVH